MNVQPISKMHGVEFFDKPSFCIANFEKKHWLKKALSFIESFGTLLAYGLDKINVFLSGADAQMNPLINANQQGLSKKRLVVCLHGLNSNPAQFKKIAHQMLQRDVSETDIFIPRVLKKGNAKLDDVVKPIFTEIAKWAKTSDEKELVLLGVSNGGRIARAIEAEVAKSESSLNIKKLQMIAIVGACKGAVVANLANTIGLSWLMSKDISEEMPTNSKRNKQLNEDWKEGLSKGPAREYTFIASPHDWVVTNYDSSLMSVDSQNARYAIIPGHGHNSIVNAVAKVVAEIAIK